MIGLSRRSVAVAMFWIGLLATLPWYPQAYARKPRPGPADAVAAAPNPAVADCLGARCVVTVSGHQFMRDGQPWIPKGVVITGFVAPPEYLKGVYAKAHKAWGDVFLRQLQDIGVDTLRFNLSIAGLDPTNRMPDGQMGPAQKKAYLDEIVAAVDLAARYGMTSMLTISAGKPSASVGSERTPGAEAARVWSVLAPLFAQRGSVYFNAFNEPGYGKADKLASDPTLWQRWRVDHQLMVNTIRKTGARNVIILEGISTSHIWRKNTDANVPDDPLHQLAFDIHPLPTDDSQHTKLGAAKTDYYRSSDIDYWLDGWCDRHACIASAFFSGTTAKEELGRCYDSRSGPGVDSPHIAADFVDYFIRKRIGVLIFPGDWNHRMFDFPGRPGARLTSFDGFKSCDDKNMGPGELMKATWSRLR